MRTPTLTLLAALLVAAPALAQVEKTERPGVRNFARVDATIACGGAVESTAYPALKQDAFSSVINLRLGSEAGANIEESRAAAQAAGLKYIHLPFSVATPDPKVADSFLAAIADTANQPALVHCGSGNRAAGFWMIKRVLQDGWPVERARAEADALGLSSPDMADFAVAYINSHRQ